MIRWFIHVIRLNWRFCYHFSTYRLKLPIKVKFVFLMSILFRFFLNILLIDMVWDHLLWVLILIDLHLFFLFVIRLWLRFNLSLEDIGPEGCAEHIGVYFAITWNELIKSRFFTLKVDVILWLRLIGLWIWIWEALNAWRVGLWDIIFIWFF